MKSPMVIDTGPLVALIDRADHYHAWAAERASQLEGPFLTCEAVVAEACYLLRKVHGGVDAIIQMVGRGSLVLPFRLAEEAGTIAKKLTRYANVPMSLADACLVRMTEQHAGSTVFTLDRDFKIYRKSDRRIVPTIMP